jgi:hypothetical protein
MDLGREVDTPAEWTECKDSQLVSLGFLHRKVLPL